MAKRTTRAAAPKTEPKPKPDSKVTLTALVNIPGSMTGGSRVAKGEKFTVTEKEAARLRKIKYAK